MSVLIKGMKMPKDCPIRITIYPNGQVVKANAVEYEEFECVPISLNNADKIRSMTDAEFAKWLLNRDLSIVEKFSAISTNTHFIYDRDKLYDDLLKWLKQEIELPLHGEKGNLNV